MEHLHKERRLVVKWPEDKLDSRFRTLELKSQVPHKAFRTAM